MIEVRAKNLNSSKPHPGYIVRGVDDIADLVLALGIEGQVSRAVAERARDARALVEKIEGGHRARREYAEKAG